MRTLQDRIRDLRGSATQAEFAKELGVPLNTLGRYERGVNDPDLGFLIKLNTKFGVSLDWLVFGNAGSNAGSNAKSNSGTGEKAAQQSQAALGAPCQRCAKLERKLDKLETQRDELIAEARLLWKENSVLKVNLAKLGVGGSESLEL